MSSIFKRPFPGELLWSAVCRVQGRYPTLPTAIIAQLAGSPLKHVGKYFPTHLKLIADNLKHAPQITADALVTGHTLIPFVAPFLEPEDSRTARESLLGNADRPFCRRRLHMMIGATANTPMRFCPVCVVCDLERYGDVGWHACHQIAPLTICPIHQAALVPTTVLRLDLGYTPLARVANRGPVTYPDAEFQRALALSIDELSTNTAYEVGPARLRLACLEELKRSGRRITGPGAALALQSELAGLFGTDPAAASVCAGRWLRQLLRGPAQVLPFQYYAVLCRMLSIGFPQLFARAMEKRPPEQGPWPCVSTGLPCSGKKTIGTFLSIPGKQRFQCPECGTVYLRDFPVQDNADGSFDYRVASSCRRQRAAPCADACCLHEPRAIPPRDKILPSCRRIAAKREAIETYLKGNPQQFGTPLPPWLYRTERWLRAHTGKGVLPLTARRAPSRPAGHGLVQRDEEIAKYICDHVAEIREKLLAPGRPRVKLGTVLRYLVPVVHLLHSSVRRMPKTFAAIAPLLESAAQARKRRIDYIISRIVAGPIVVPWAKIYAKYNFSELSPSEREHLRAVYLTRAPIRRGRPPNPK